MMHHRAVFNALISGGFWIHITTVSQLCCCRSAAWIIHADTNIMVLIGPTILACEPTLLASGLVCCSSTPVNTHTPKHHHFLSVYAANWWIFDSASSSVSVWVCPDMWKCMHLCVCVCVRPNGKEISFCIFAFSAQVLLECLEGRMVGFAGEVGWVLKQAKAFALPFKDNQLSWPALPPCGGSTSPRERARRLRHMSQCLEVTGH